MANTQPWRKFYTDAAKAFDPSKTAIPLLSDLPGAVAEKFGDKDAFTIVLPNGTNAKLSYNDIHRLSDDFAVYLREDIGLKRGDVVAIQSPNCLAYPITVFGVLKAGCVLTNTNPLYTEPEMVHQFNDSGARVLVIIDMFGDKVDRVINQTKIEKIIRLHITDFLSPFKRILIGAVLKYVKKQIPKMETPSTAFIETLAKGAHLKHKNHTDVSAYTKGISKDDDAVYQYTGGTTGVSKGARLTHHNLLSNLEQVRIFLGNFSAEGEVTILTALPLYHIFAFTINMCVNMVIGGNNILIPSPRPLENMKVAFDNHNVSWMTGVNTLYAGLLQTDWFNSKVRLSAAGGTSLQSVVGAKWTEKIGLITEGYGLTESAPVLTFNPPEGPIKADTVGIPVPGVEVKLVGDDGQIVATGELGEFCARGPNIMPGYLNRPEATADTIRDGWLHTGDVAIMDEDGFFKIVDRKKDMILVSGFNVYPNELENAISQLEGVAEVAVIGVPDARSGETPKAFIVKASPSLSDEMVREHCKGMLAAYKLPKHIEFRQELPKTPIGKILRKELKKQEAEKASL